MLIDDFVKNIKKDEKYYLDKLSILPLNFRSILLEIIFSVKNDFVFRYNFSNISNFIIILLALISLSFTYVSVVVFLLLFWMFIVLLAINLNF